VSVLFVDGWFGPDPGDWQELWAENLPGSIRVAQADWERPERHSWVTRLDQAIAECCEPPVLIAHSLGCLTVAAWAADHGGRPVRAAMLVTPADVERNPEPAIRGFAPIPSQALPFPALVVASGNDQWMTLGRARFFADAWEARFAEAGAVGHMMASEGYGPWPEGEELLAALLDASSGSGLAAG
jgi:uncharacterized protein